jgi:hypothetical protein
LPWAAQVRGVQAVSQVQVWVLQTSPAPQLSGQVSPHWSLPQQRPAHWGVQSQGVLQAVFSGLHSHSHCWISSSRFPQESAQ